MMIASVLLPHVAVLEATAVPGRSLLAGQQLLPATRRPGPRDSPAATSVTAVALALTTTYIGLALQQIGLLLIVRDRALGACSSRTSDGGSAGSRWLPPACALVLGASTTVLGLPATESTPASPAWPASPGCPPCSLD